MSLLLSVVVVVLIAGSIQLSRGYAPDSHNIGPYWNSLEKQTEYIKTHKIKYLKICIRTCVEYGSNWIEMLSILGSLDTSIHRLSSYLFNIFLVVLAVIDQPYRVRPTARMKLAALVASAISFGLLLTAQYTWHSPVGGRIIEGIQGRYLIPLFPFFLILLNSRSIQVRADCHSLLVMTSTACVAYLIVAIGAIVQRFYLSDPARLLSPMHVVSMAILVRPAKGPFRRVPRGVSARVVLGRRVPRQGAHSDRGKPAGRPGGHRVDRRGGRPPHGRKLSVVPDVEAPGDTAGPRPHGLGARVGSWRPGRRSLTWDCRRRRFTTR
jgi:hypothetical protein